MCIQLLGYKVFKNRAKVYVWIQTEQSRLNVSSIHCSKQTHIVEKEFEQISLLVQKQRSSRFLDIVCWDSYASIKYKQAEYLSDKIGKVFPALISGVSKWGLYAEIEGSKCEGMIPIDSLQGDYYMLDEDNYQVIGRRYGKCYKLGYPVNIRVKRVDMLKKQIDFELVEDQTDNPQQDNEKRNERRTSARHAAKRGTETSGNKKKTNKSSKSRSKQSRSKS